MVHVGLVAQDSYALYAGSLSFCSELAEGEMSRAVCIQCTVGLLHGTFACCTLMVSTVVIAFSRTGPRSNKWQEVNGVSLMAVWCYLAACYCPPLLAVTFSASVPLHLNGHLIQFFAPQFFQPSGSEVEHHIESEPICRSIWLYLATCSTAMEAMVHGNR